MLYTFLITIVFIAELIIAVTILLFLINMDKKILEIDCTVTELKPSVKDISDLVAKISKQILELSEDFVEKFKTKNEETVLRLLNKMLIALILWKINSKTIKKIRHSKVFKTISRGFNLLQNMV